MISKKDLLKEKNISYGQLYRWKREGLIPDEWFIKQSVSTGQETFFKRELIIPRIDKILSLKDNYELQEIKDLFSNQKKKNYNAREVILIDEIDPYILKTYLNGRKELSITELGIIYIFSKHQDKLQIEDYLEINFNNTKFNDMNLYICSHQNKYFIVFGSDSCIIDSKIKIECIEKIEDAISYIAVKIRED